ncbi:ATP-dependent DNA helicase PIF1 [Linum grandiflorum]
MFWPNEALSCARRRTHPQFPLCCQLGKVDLLLLKPTPPLLDQLLAFRGDVVSKHFRDKIRTYNAAFSWTSFGAKLDPRLMHSRGPYSSVLCGENYHYMGSLLPPEGQRPRYNQLYVHYPTSEVSDRLSNIASGPRTLNAGLITELQAMLDHYNVLTQSFRRVRDALQEPSNQNLRLRITGARVERDRMYELPTGTELAGLIPGDFAPDRDDRDIIVNNRSTGLCRITSLNPLFDSLHFPLLFPHGNDGYHNRIRYNPLHLDPEKKRKYVTQREYYCFRLQYRPNEGKTLIRGGKALQHFCIDAFTTIEQNRLTYLRLNQTKLRSDIYKGLCNIINPSSFTGSVRYMQQLYHDAMAVTHYYNNPDLFITFTCNAQWPEIIEAFKDDVGTHSEDKPMVVARVFRMRLRLLKEDLNKASFFGKNVASMHTVEFQKRGLPHVHIILWLQDIYKPTTPAKVDHIISAELPDPQHDPVGYDAVTKFMLHGPCGDTHPTCPCMKNNKCSKYFPKPYASETTFDEHGHVTYRRRATAISAVKSGATLDNAFVVPYNRNLLVKYQAHMNVEICHKGQLIKYLFKYITKGPDRSEVTAERRPEDEIAQYLDCRSISSYEAIWRLYGFKIHERSPAVFRLCVHLPNEHTVAYPEHQSVPSIINRPGVEKTMLTEWFTLNRSSPSARKYLYSEITHAYVWDKDYSLWTPRKKGFVIGRIASVPPRTDVFFGDLRTVNGVLCRDYQEACQMLGLLANDDEWNAVMAEVSQWGMPPLIRSTYVSLLLFCQVASPIVLFNQWWPSMSDDFRHQLEQLSENPHPNPIPDTLRNKVLTALQTLLHNYSTTLSNFGLPSPTNLSTTNLANDLIAQELAYDCTRENTTYNLCRASLNEHQQKAHDAVMESLDNNSGKLFFLYGHGGTGKTYLYNCILSKVRSQRIAATLLPGGVTAHSRFKIPIEVDHSSTCMIKKGTALAQLIQETTLIVWDEAPMVHRLSFEAVDRTICDIMNKPTTGPDYKPFGGKTVLLGGDFRQTLPSRAIVTPTNLTAATINDYILDKLPGRAKIYLSSDSLTTPGPNQFQLDMQYPTEFLNGLSFNGMPEHQLKFKPYCIVMLLRNLNPSAGLCNGTRILLTHLASHVVRGLIVGGSFDGTVAVIPRIILDKADANWPFTLRRRQFPLKICYAMTINKSQGQTLDQVGLYLPSPVFSHGQLYVAISRVRSATGIHIVIENDASTDPNITRNIVYEEIYADLHVAAATSIDPSL